MAGDSLYSLDGLQEQPPACCKSGKTSVLCSTALHCDRVRLHLVGCSRRQKVDWLTDHQTSKKRQEWESVTPVSLSSFFFCRTKYAGGISL